ncbi:Molybdate-binding periplasmic protein precursor [Anaerococcus prevotii]|uniref:Molybdenum ABC transporter, periplasmic molybdate-binding protein n=1 Tax=Anaerococcus prevotii (strain ATCC 9321 / DSM 20548 / JCM 6508 / NCTC 11806 / PC1) TaxID=525919 RepID=C7RE53_ANAPD|nr:molybdate ABC transporter substrate-binding protein [Anaerococcus prevotii]ACV29466.1 molybdenum ABC transporter, periplasmic molybdate-binding protein [Anaerococcus prevotii DSM 20548]SUU95138.1 Molybdate-binding periplasmic protein precursor [Anaerococcus prevotii]
MKKMTGIFLALLFSVTLAACGAKAPAGEDVNDGKMSEKKKDDKSSEKTDLNVFAAASMTESLEDLKEVFEDENPGINLVFNFDSSGTLKTQIAEGADCDVFISAAQKQMDALDPNSDSKEGDITIDPSSRFDLLENEVTLAVREDSNKDITSFDDIKTDKVATIGLGNADVPVGQYSESLLKNMGIWEVIQDKISFGSNVKEVTSWLTEGAVDCGIIYSTDAKAAGLRIVDTADPDMLDKKVIYPAALIENSPNREAGEKFLEFLKTDRAREVFVKYGFKPAS